MNQVYLDHNATSPLRPVALEAMREALSLGANASSVHGPGRRARALVETARETLAGLVGAPLEAVTFTGSGTEADNLAVSSLVNAAGCRRLLISGVEHDAVWAPAHESGAAVEIIPVSSEGVVDVGWLEARLDAWDAVEGPPGVAVMVANNETGVIQPIADVARRVRDAGGYLLVDGVQGLGKLRLDMTALGAHYLTLSAHKLGGPHGAGALIAAAEAPLIRQLHGGGQERGRRAGTENVAAIVGFAAAAREASEAREAQAPALAGLRDALESRIAAARPDVTFFGAQAPRLTNTSCFGAPGFASETQVMSLDLAGFAVSAGAACSSGKVKASRALMAMGADETLAACALRVSLGWTSTARDVEAFAAAWLTAAERVIPQHAA